MSVAWMSQDVQAALFFGGKGQVSGRLAKSVTYVVGMRRVSPHRVIGLILGGYRPKGLAEDIG